MEKKRSPPTGPFGRPKRQGVKMITNWIQEIKQAADPRELGMILIHNGLVRASSKEGKPVRKFV